MALAPIPFVATTVNVYDVPFFNPASGDETKNGNGVLRLLQARVGSSLVGRVQEPIFRSRGCRPCRCQRLLPPPSLFLVRGPFWVRPRAQRMPAATNDPGPQISAGAGILHGRCCAGRCIMCWARTVRSRRSGHCACRSGLTTLSADARPLRQHRGNKRRTTSDHDDGIRVALDGCTRACLHEGSLRQQAIGI